MLFSKFKTFNRANKSLLHKGGRNNHGRITVNHQGGGHKRIYRQIDWKRSFEEGIITNFEYDPNRSAYLMKIYAKKNYSENYTYYHCIAPKGVKILDKIRTFTQKTRSVQLRAGDTSILANFEFGDFLHNVEDIPGEKVIFARSAGTFCQVLQHASAEHLRLRLPSGSQRLVPVMAKGTFGVVANENHILQTIGKAGRSRWLNKRPSVRGVAMNPVDHPHGGGQGKTKGGRPSVTPWSRPTKGQPTRNPRKRNIRILTSTKTVLNKVK